MSEAADLQRIRLAVAKRADGQTAGLYAITCGITGRFYVGSSRRIADRLGRHRRDLRAGRHHCIPLQRAWAKYGEDAFSFDLLMVTTSADDLLRWEQDYLSADYLRPLLFNTCFIAGTCEGRPQSSETREKRAAALRGSRRTPEQCRRISEARKAATVSERGLANINAANAKRRFRFTEDQLREALKLRAAGASLSQMERVFRVSRHAIKRELDGRHV